MNLAQWFVASMAVGNLCAAVAYAHQKKFPLACVYLCYAGSCIALIWVDQ